MYGRHPSEELNKLFREKPFQGQDPEKAGVVIFGIDANYPLGLEQERKQLGLVKEYHRDGVAFWRDHKKHHPFLLPAFGGQEGGLNYHRNFTRLGLSEQYAACICFVELLNVPTFGRTEENVFWELFDQGNVRGYAERFDDLLIRSTTRKLILLCDDVIEKMLIIKNKYKIFNWMPSRDDIKKSKENSKELAGTSKWSGVFKLNAGTILHHEVVRGYHFSSTHAKRKAFIDEIKSRIDDFCIS